MDRRIISFPREFTFSAAAGFRAPRSDEEGESFDPVQDVVEALKNSVLLEPMSASEVAQIGQRET